MLSFNAYWGGLDYIQDTPAEDGMALVFTPSLASDAIAGGLQLESEASVQQFMQVQFRQIAENMADMGLFASTQV